MHDLNKNNAESFITNAKSMWSLLPWWLECWGSEWGVLGLTFGLVMKIVPLDIWYFIHVTLIGTNGYWRWLWKYTRDRLTSNAGM